MRLSDEAVEKIIEISINHLMKNPEKKVRLGDMEVDYKTIAEALSMMDKDLKRKIAEEIVDAALNPERWQ